MKIIDLEDRFARLLVAGLFASILLVGLNLFSYYVIHLSERRFINYSALMIFGRSFNNFAEALLSVVAQIGFATGIFIIFSYLLLKKGRNNYLLRGLFIGFGSWFAIMSLSYIIGIHNILTMDIGSALSFMVTSSIWGIAGAWILQVLDQKYGIERESQSEVNKLNFSRRVKLFISPEPAYKINFTKPIKPKKTE